MNLERVSSTSKVSMNSRGVEIISKYVYRHIYHIIYLYVFVFHTYNVIFSFTIRSITSGPLRFIISNSAGRNHKYKLFILKNYGS